MIRDIRLHSTHYAVLAGFLSLMWITFLVVRGNEPAEVGIVILTGLGYVAWGVGHHYLNHDLSAKIVSEYVLMAILAISILVAALVSR